MTVHGDTVNKNATDVRSDILTNLSPTRMWTPNQKDECG